MRFACRSALQGLAVLSFTTCGIANAVTAGDYEVRVRQQTLLVRL